MFEYSGGEIRDGEAVFVGYGKVYSLWDTLEERQRELENKQQKDRACAEDLQKLFTLLNVPLKAVANDNYIALDIETPTKLHAAVKAALERLQAWSSLARRF